MFVVAAANSLEAIGARSEGTERENSGGWKASLSAVSDEEESAALVLYIAGTSSLKLSIWEARRFEGFNLCRLSICFCTLRRRSDA